MPNEGSVPAGLTRCSRCRQQYVVMPEEDLVVVPDQMDCQTAAQFYVSACGSTSAGAAALACYGAEVAPMAGNYDTTFVDLGCLLTADQPSDMLWHD
jgi:hypothetical protein